MTKRKKPKVEISKFPESRATWGFFPPSQAPLRPTHRIAVGNEVFVRMPRRSGGEHQGIMGHVWEHYRAKGGHETFVGYVDSVAKFRALEEAAAAF